MVSGFRCSAAICIMAFALVSPPAFAEADPVQPGAGEVLKLPGLPDIKMPPGVHVYGPRGDAPNGMTPGRPDGGMVVGPGGVLPNPDLQPMPKRKAAAPPKRVPTPAERAEAIRKALQPHPPLAVARRHTLDELYGKLAVASDTEEAKGLAGLISAIWMRTSSDTANLLMQRAVVSIQGKNLDVAAQLLDKLVVLDPSWAEAWNKRASVRFAKGDLDGSMADVKHVLQLEPKHFGALEGMAMILQRTGFDKQALEVYRRALAVYPHQHEVQQIVDKLTIQVEGQGI
jgi:tetratricopeptide (TPR) repeat protein